MMEVKGSSFDLEDHNIYQSWALKGFSEHTNTVSSLHKTLLFA